MRVKKYRYFVGDFETTVYDGQTFTEVWASGLCELYSEDYKIFNSIDDTFKYIFDLQGNICVYYHNLKFDGAFILSYLIEKLEFKQAYIKLNKEGTRIKWLHEAQMPNKSFKYSISDKGLFYSIIIHYKNKYVEIRDSLKLLPFSLEKIGKSFETKHKKLNMEYEGYRFAGCEITEKEKEYLRNDLFVLKEALEIMFDEGHKKLTIGSCCLSEFKNITGKDTYNDLFPDLTQTSIKPPIYKYANADEYIRRSYKGGWCYLVKGRENKVCKNGITADVNSLYPSVMHSESGNKYPIGQPYFWHGNFIPDIATQKDKYYFIRIKTRFYLKKGFLPFIQIKGSYLYRGNECLETSDFYDKKTGKYYSYYYDEKQELHDTRVELVLTMTDFELLKRHYDLVDFEILDGCFFEARSGLFDAYINKYKEIKINSTGAKRELAKLFLNNLYGKLASGTVSSFKVAYLKDDKSIGFITVTENEKKAGYIAIGSAITSYARCFTITAAQKNFYGAGKRGFIYADTDSIHCDLNAEELKGITVHDVNFCCWKLESSWDEAIFVRQKTYIEHVTHENLKEVEKAWYNIKCAGMPQKCKNLFIESMTGNSNVDKQYTDDEINFLKTRRTLSDFKIGLKVPGKLYAKRIHGGIILTETPYEMRPI